MDNNIKKMELLEEDKSQKELENFMEKYNSIKQGGKVTLKMSDFHILVKEIERLKNINSNYEDVIYKLDNEKNELKIKLKKYYAEYKRVYKLAEKYKTEMEELRKKAFIPKKKVQQITDQQIQEIKKLRSDGLSYSEIESETKWSKYTISKVLNGHYDVE